MRFFGFEDFSSNVTRALTAAVLFGKNEEVGTPAMQLRIVAAGSSGLHSAKNKDRS